MVPETRYVKLGDSRVAYRVVGDGPIDVVVNMSLHMSVDALSEEPAIVRFLDRLSTFCRHIWFDGRGRGGSDPMPSNEARFVENMADDMLALLDKLELERAAVIDLGYGAPSLLFAAAHPERVSALALLHPVARVRRALDYQDGWAETTVAGMVGSWTDTWGTDDSAALVAPSAIDDRRFARWLARAERASCSPGEVLWRLATIVELDIRPILPTITVPTLVITPRESPFAPFSRFVAEHIVGARHCEVSGSDFLFFTGDPTPVLDALEQFLTGRLPLPNLDRVLATVLFTDVVGSTEHASQMGDRRWLELLATHDTVVRASLQQFRGREVQSMGDGFLATFDGPGRAVRCACAIRDAVRDLGVEMRIGLHTGEIELQGDDVGGIAVHIAARVMTEAQPGEIIVSSTVRDLVTGSGITFEDRGARTLRGVPEQWRLFAATV